MHKFFLIRHGESLSNVGLATTAPKDAELTTLGQEQARQIADFLKNYTSLNRVVTSAYVRTKRTAEPTMRAFRLMSSEEWGVQEFTYLSSKYLGYSTIEERRPLVEAYWEQLLPFERDGPGSESFADFIKRVRTFLRKLDNEEYQDMTIAVFSHEQFINAVLWLIERESVEVSAKTMREFRGYLKRNPLHNGAIVQMRWSNHENRWRSEKVPEIFYLQRDVPEPEPAAEYVHLKHAMSGPEPPLKRSTGTGEMVAIR